MKLIPVLLLMCAAGFAQVQADFEIYLGSYDASEAGNVVISLPEGKLTPSFGPSVAEEIQKTFHLKTFDLLAAPRIVTPMGMPAHMQSGSNPAAGEKPAKPGQSIGMTFTVDALKDGVAHVKLEYTLDQRSPSGAEFMAKMGQPVTLSSRVDNHLLFIICTLKEAGKTIPPQVIKKVPPAYPEDLKKDKISGMAVLRLTIDARGKVTSCVAAKSDHEKFTEAGCAAVRQWEFKSGTKDGKPASMDYFVSLNFRLAE